MSRLKRSSSRALAVFLASWPLHVPAGAQANIRIPPPVLTAPGPQGIRLDEAGLVANWYPPPPGGRAPVVMLLGGSEGGIGPGAARQAASLVAHGYAVLQIAYFGAAGLPSKLDMVPLEYFDRALTWLEKRADVDPRRLAIVGASKGAEAALLIAARHPEVRAVVVGMPSIAVWPGIDFAGGPTRSSWSLDGKPVPYLRFAGQPNTMFEAYAAALKTLRAHPEARIKVENVKARMLLICGRSDTLWPSCPMAGMIAARLGSRAQVLAFDDAGHAVFGPPVPHDDPAYPTLGSLGGSPAGNADARVQAWPRVIAFLSRWLGADVARKTDDRYMLPSPADVERAPSQSL